MADPLETYAKICQAVAREHGKEASPERVAREIQSRIDALPPDERSEINDAVERLTSFTAPGFSEHGPN